MNKNKLLELKFIESTLSECKSTMIKNAVSEFALTKDLDVARLRVLYRFITNTVDYENPYPFSVYFGVAQIIVTLDGHVVDRFSFPCEPFPVRFETDLICAEQMFKQLTELDKYIFDTESEEQNDVDKNEDVDFDA